jgi:hypothetical protein
MGAFDEVMAAIWKGHDPYAGFPLDAWPADTRGWNSTHPWLAEAVAARRPRLIVEVGVWRGGSVLTMADALRDAGVEGCIVAVDTWLGSVEHWAKMPSFPANLNVAQGQPRQMQVFLGNVIRAGHAGRVVPLPMDSLNAAQLLRHYGLRPDLLHLDAGHDQISVGADLAAWWPLLQPGGVLIGDDYHATGGWPGVRKAFHAFFGARGLMPLEHTGGKCRVTKRGRAGGAPPPPDSAARGPSAPGSAGAGCPG